MNWVEGILRYWFIVMRGKFSFLFIFPTRTFREFVFHSISNSLRQFQFKFNRIEIFQTHSRKGKSFDWVYERKQSSSVHSSAWKYFEAYFACCFWQLFLMIVSVDFSFEIFGLKSENHSTRKLKLYWIICQKQSHRPPVQSRFNYNFTFFAQQETLRDFH